jgi:SAM-dependent methyltransferase
MTDRAEREREFWNEARSSGEAGRVHVVKYYAIGHERLAHYQAILEECAKRRLRMLEIGCSNGGTAISLALLGAKVVGVDISDVAIQEAQARAESSAVAIQFVVADASRLPFDDASFDVIFGSAVVHHLDLKSFALEASRVVRPGGKAVFLEPMGHNPAIRIYRGLTPRARTSDERPLLDRDIDVLRSAWDSCKATPFDLTTLLAVPLRNRGVFEPVLKALRATDRWLFRIPLLRRNAWFVLLELGHDDDE